MRLIKSKRCKELSMFINSINLNKIKKTMKNYNDFYAAHTCVCRSKQGTVMYIGRNSIISNIHPQLKFLQWKGGNDIENDHN